jgi:hypothetical protein
MSYTSQQTNSQTLNGIITLTDGVVTIEDGTITGLDEIALDDLQVSDTATIENLVVNNQIDMTSGKITNLANATNANDAVNKSQLDLKADTTYVDTNFLNKTTATTQIVNSNLNMNTTNKIINLANGSSSNDAVNKSQLDLKADTTYVDTNFLNKTTATTQIVNSNLNMNTTNKIINLANGSTSNDAVNKSQLDLKSDTTYVDTNFLNKTTATTQIVNSNLDMNTTNKIINLANGTNANDAVNKSQLDLKSDTTYLDTNFLNKTTATAQIVNSNLDMNTTNKIINLANGTNANDAVNKSQLDLKSDTTYLDTNFLNKTTATAQIVNSNLDMNTKRIYNLSNPTTQTDAVNLSYLSTNYLNKTTTFNQTIANKVSFTNTTTDIVGNPVISMFNAIGGASNGNFLRFQKGVVETTNTEIGGLSACDKNIGNTLIRVADLIFSRGSNAEARMDLKMIDGQRNPLRITDGEFTSKNNSHYFLKQDGTNLLNYTSLSDKFTMSKPIDIETTNHIAFYNSDLTADSGMKMYFDRSAGSLGRFYLDMRGSEIQIRTDSGSEPTSERVKINNNETQINNNLKCNGSVTLGNNINNDTTTFNSVATFNADVLVNNNNHLMLGGNPASTQGMRLVYDAGFQANGTAYIDSRATSLIFRLNTTTEPTSTRVVIGANQTLVNSGFAVNGNTIIGNDPTSDTCLFNCQATFPDDSKLTFVAGSNLEFNLLSFATFNTGSGLNINDSAINFNEGAVVNGSRVNLRSVSGNLTMSNSNTEGGILCTNTSTISITLPPKDAYWNNRSFYLKTQTGNVNIVMNTGTSIDNDYGTLQITTDYRGYLFGFDNDYVNNGKIWKLVAI